MDYKKIGLECLRFRKRLGMTQEQMANKMGYVGGTYISRIENCDYITDGPYVDFLDKLWDVFGEDKRGLMQDSISNAGGKVTFETLDRLVQAVGDRNEVLEAVIDLIRALQGDYKRIVAATEFLKKG